MFVGFPSPNHLSLLDHQLELYDAHYSSDVGRFEVVINQPMILVRFALGLSCPPAISPASARAPPRPSFRLPGKVGCCLRTGIPAKPANFWGRVTQKLLSGDYTYPTREFGSSNFQSRSRHAAAVANQIYQIMPGFLKQRKLCFWEARSSWPSELFQFLVNLPSSFLEKLSRSIPCGCSYWCCQKNQAN